MRRAMMLAGLVAITLAGCGKKTAKNTAPDTPPPPATPAAPATQSTAHVSSFGDKPANPNQSGNLTGGSGGIFAPRVAAARTVNQAQLKDLHLNLSQTWLLESRLPSLDELKKDARQNPQLAALLDGDVIILTGAKSGDAIWAYTQYPQRANEHYVVVSQGVIPMPTDQLQKRLEAEKAPIKLSK